MKKRLLLAMALLLFLSGCQLFGGPDKEAVATYADAQAETLQASADTDKALNTLLDATIAANDAAFDPAVLVNDIRNAKRVQEALLQKVGEPPGRLIGEDLRSIYAAVIEGRIRSYEGYVQAIEFGDLASLKEAVASHRIKDERQLAKALIDVNHELKALKLAERESVLPAAGEKKEAE